MGKDLKGNPLPPGIMQRKSGIYRGRFYYKGETYTKDNADLKKLVQEMEDLRYEVKHGLKDGKPVEDPDKNKKTEEELLKDLSPELKAYLESMRKSVDDMAKKVGDSITNSANEAKKETVRKQLKDAGLPDNWLGRVDLASETSIEDQIKALSEEFTGIQQKAIDDAVARGDYAPGSVNLPERSEADWAKLMDQDADKSANNPGVVNLGIE